MLLDLQNKYIDIDLFTITISVECSSLYIDCKSKA